MITPICVAAAVSEIVGDWDRLGSLASGWNAFASPKSSTFTVPSVKGGAKSDHRGGGKLDHPAVEWRG